MSARQKRRGERESPWNIPRPKEMRSVRMVPSSEGKLILVFHLGIIAVMKSLIVLSILYKSSTSVIHSCGTLSYAFL